MSNTVIALRQSGETSNTPSLGVLANGELALNFADGILYYKTSSNTLGSILTATPGGLDTEVQFNDGGSFGGDSSFTYNKTTNTLTIDNVTTGGLNVAPTLQASFNQANTANITAEASFSKANAANVLAQAAFDNSNTKFNSSGGTISGNVFVTGSLFPSVDNNGVVGNSAFTWHNGQFTDLTIDNILNVRTAIDLADGDILRFGTNDDWEMFHDGTANRIDLNVGDLTIRDDGTAGDPTRFTFGRTTGDFTANGNVSATNFLVGGLNVNEHAQAAFDQANTALNDSLAFAIALG